MAAPYKRTSTGREGVRHLLLPDQARERALDRRDEELSVRRHVGRKARDNLATVVDQDSSKFQVIFVGHTEVAAVAAELGAEVSAGDRLRRRGAARELGVERVLARALDYARNRCTEPMLMAIGPTVLRPSARS